MDLSVVVKVSLKSLNLDMKFLSVFCFLFFFTSFEVGSLYIIVLHLQLHLQFDGSVMLIGLLCCVLQTMSTASNFVNHLLMLVYCPSSEETMFQQHYTKIL